MTMTGQETFSDQTLQYWLSVRDDACQGAAAGALPALLRSAPSASLFILSRRAACGLVRAEAEKALTARLPAADAAETAAPAGAAACSELPPELASHRHFYKFAEQQRWVLATRSGRRIASFASEAELDRWWGGLKKQRGRMLTRVRRDVPVSESAAPRPELSQ